MNPLLYPSLFVVPALGSVGTIAALRDDQTNLTIIFGFVLCIILIMLFFKHQRAKMWHETARIALEKGQPLPSRWDLPPIGGPIRGMGTCNYWTPWWELRRGLVLLAVSVGLYYGLNEHARGWIAIPACIGAVYFVLGLIGLMRGDNKNPPDHRDPPAQP